MKINTSRFCSLVAMRFLISNYSYTLSIPVWNWYGVVYQKYKVSNNHPYLSNIMCLTSWSFCTVCEHSDPSLMNMSGGWISCHFDKRTSVASSCGIEIGLDGAASRSSLSHDHLDRQRRWTCSPQHAPLVPLEQGAHSDQSMKEVTSSSGVVLRLT